MYEIEASLLAINPTCGNKKEKLMENLPESDWEVFKGIRDDLFEALCARINGKALKIINQKGKSQHEKYFKLNKHIRKSDKIVSKCFDDFDSSKLSSTLMTLREEEVLADYHLASFSKSANEFLEKI